MVLQRVSYAIVFLCLIQVAAWTHPVGVAAANDSAGAEAMQLLRDQYESTVGNFKSGIGDSLTARQLIEGKVFEEAGSRKPPPLPPDPEPTRVPSQATSGERSNSKRAAASAVNAAHPATSPDQHRRLAAMNGRPKKSSKRGAADGSVLLQGLAAMLVAGGFVGGVAVIGRSASTVFGTRGAVRAASARIPVSSVARFPLRASVPLVSGASHPMYGSTLQTQPSASSSIDVPVHGTTAWDWVSRPSEIAAALSYKMGGGVAAGGGNIASLLGESDDASFCDDMLQKTSRSFAAVIQQLPPELRPGVCVFYLMLRALDTIEDDMTVDLQPKISLLRAFHERVQDPTLVVRGYGFDDERVLLEELPRLLRVFKALPSYQQEVITDITKRMGEGMAEFAGADLRDGVGTIDDYNLYCHYVAGLVGEGLTRLFASAELEPLQMNSSSSSASSSSSLSLQSSSGSDDDMLKLSNDMGLMLQKTNIIRDFLEDYVDGRTWWPREIWGRYVPTLASLADPAHAQQATACLNHMVTDALELLPSCAAYLDRLQDDSVLRFCLIPQLMAAGTQAACFNNKDVFTGIVKIRPGLAAKLILSTQQQQQQQPPQQPQAEGARGGGAGGGGVAAQRAAAKEWFVEFARQIEAKIDDNDPNAERTRRAVLAVEECCARGKSKSSGGPKEKEEAAAPEAMQQV